MPPLKGHDPALDGLRGLAILAVLVHHSVLAGAPVTAVDQAVRSAFAIGWIGVDLFFVLSGYLITGILLDTKGGAGYFRSFYARRALRIFPLYCAALAVIFVVVPRVAGPLIEHPEAYTVGQVWVWTYLTNVHVALAGTWEVISPLAIPFWSLAVEEQFYMVWPLAVLVLSRRAVGWTAAAMMGLALGARIVLAALGDYHLAVYVLPFTRMDALAAGALIAVAERSPGGLAGLSRHATRTGMTCAAVVLGIVLATGDATYHPVAMRTVGFTALALGFGALLIIARTRAPGVLAVGWLRRLGERSYGVYVWHLLAVRAVAAVGLPARLPTIGEDAAARQLLATGVVLALAWAAAEVSWHCLEAPILRLKRLVPRPDTARPVATVRQRAAA